MARSASFFSSPLPLLLLLSLGMALVLSVQAQSCPVCDSLESTFQQNCQDTCKACKSCGMWSSNVGSNNVVYGCKFCAALIPVWGWVLLVLGAIAILGGITCCCMCCIKACCL